MANLKFSVFILSTLTLFVGHRPLAAFPLMAVHTNNSCFACHGQLKADQPEGVSLSGQKDGRVVSGKMSVVATGVTVDLGTQLDGSMPGPLTAFQVEAGSVVHLNLDVLDGVDAHAIQLKQFEKGGQKLSESNQLVWSAANESGNPWDERSLNGSPPYFTKGVLGGTDPTRYEFDLAVDAATPEDVYHLVYAVAGQDEQGLFYQEEAFYLEVMAGPDVAPAALVNISTRGLVSAGDGILIGGFVIDGGSAPAGVLIRGIGPALEEFGIQNAVVDPVIEVFRTDSSGASTSIAMNDNWGDDPAVAEAALAVGAFPLSAGSLDAALVLSDLLPGSYTVHLRSGNVEPRVALIEIYQLD